MKNTSPSHEKSKPSRMSRPKEGASAPANNAVTTKSVLAIGFASQTPSRESFNSAQRSAATAIARNVQLSTSTKAGRVFNRAAQL